MKRVAVVVTLTIWTAAVATVALGIEPAGAVARSASCTESGVTWRVEYEETDTVLGPRLQITGLRRTEGGTTTDAGSMTWVMRRDNGHQPFMEVSGGLAVLGAQGWPALYSPRLVTPDGSCTVYLSPFYNFWGPTTGPRVAVLGDELVQQLGDATYNQTHQQGYVQGEANAVGIRVEVEGHSGRRWTEPAGLSGLARADTVLLDEYRGLLEHDADGYVFALGVNDALYIAAGVTDAERQDRIDEVYARWQTILEEVSHRTSCVVAVTAPENASSLDPDYAQAALAVNSFIRYTTAVPPPGAAAGWEGLTDSWSSVDFAADAAGHLATDPEPWFAADNVHLAGAGLDAYTKAIVAAARQCGDQVVGYGAAGSFDGPLASQSRVPSGQSFRTQAVDGWVTPPGRDEYISTTTVDGTVLMAEMSHSRNAFTRTGVTMSVGAFQPDELTFQDIRLTTSTGQTEMRSARQWFDPPADCPQPPGTPCWSPGPAGMDLGDVEAFPDENAAAFVGASPEFGYQDLAASGWWPVFGILTEAAGGWGVASGNGWDNQWTADKLYAAADTDAERAMVDLACPQFTPFLLDIQVRSCKSLQEMTVLPGSGDVVATQYFGRGGAAAGLDGTGSGQVVVFDVDPHPTTPGRYEVEVRAVYQYPLVHDPSQPAGSNRILWIAPLGVRSDPSSTAGDERFAVTSDTVYWSGDHDGDPATEPVCPGHAPGAIVEFRYDESAGTLAPVSAPVLTGAVSRGKHNVAPERDCTSDNRYRMSGAGAFYDAAGNLWAPLSDGAMAWVNNGLAVYPKTSTGRAISNGTCPFNGDLGSYSTEATGADGTTTRRAWGSICAPRYNLLQHNHVGPAWAMSQDPATKTIVATGPRGVTYLVHPNTETNPTSFRVSQHVSSTATGLSAGSSLIDSNHRVDPTGRLYTPVANFLPGGAGSDPANRLLDLDSYMVSIATRGLFGRGLLRLSARAGQASIVEAEQHSTFGTSPVPGTFATTDLDPLAAVVNANGGLVLGDDTGAGVSAGTTVDYVVAVPKAGSYQVSYRGRVPSGTTGRTLRLSFGGTNHDRTIPASSTMQTVAGPTLTFSQPGWHTIRVSAPSGQGGWQLDSISFTRQ